MAKFYVSETWRLQQRTKRHSRVPAVAGQTETGDPCVPTAVSTMFGAFIATATPAVCRRSRSFRSGCRSISSQAQACHTVLGSSASSSGRLGLAGSEQW